MAEQAVARDSDGLADVRCWCCGRARDEGDIVRLGEHPEVAVCLDCAHFVKGQGPRGQSAAVAQSAGAGRDAGGTPLRMERGWQNLPLFGPVLRWLGRRFP